MAAKSKPRRRKGAPYNPAKQSPPHQVHDRRAVNVQERNREFGELEVDDPYDTNGGKIVAIRSFRDDPLGRMHARRQIDEAQYQGGRSFQRDFEIAERGPQAVDPSKEYVDGGNLPEPITEQQQKAARQLAIAHKKLGADGSALTHDVLVHGRSMEQICERRGLTGRPWEEYFGAKFRLECLNRLAVLYGFAQPDGRGLDNYGAKALQTSQ